MPPDLFGRRSTASTFLAFPSFPLGITPPLCLRHLSRFLGATGYQSAAPTHGGYHPAQCRGSCISLSNGLLYVPPSREPSRAETVGTTSPCNHEWALSCPRYTSYRPEPFFLGYQEDTSANRSRTIVVPASNDEVHREIGTARDGIHGQFALKLLAHGTLL